MIRALAVAAFVLALPAGAQGATVSVFVPPCGLEQSKYAACYPDEARFVAADGEQNRITVARAADPPTYRPKLTFTDSGAPLTAGAGCTQVDEHTATCVGSSVIAIVTAGDGDDTVAGSASSVDGGPGNDELSGAQMQNGGPGDDKLTGADTGSLLQGGPGRDAIRGGASADTILDNVDAGVQDVVDGGGGIDTMSYAGRKSSVAVSLQQPLAGEDQLASIESLRGGDGPDTLTGDAGANTLDGGAGRDILIGGDGPDVLAGGESADQLDGGAGDDSLNAGEDKARNRIACGEGNDAADPALNTLIGADCERIGVDDFDVGGLVLLRLPLSSPRAALLTMKPFDCFYRPCTVRLTITAKGRVLGETRVVRRKRKQKLPSRVTLRMSKAGLRALKRAGHLEARVRVAVIEDGEVEASSFLVTL